MTTDHDQDHDDQLWTDEARTDRDRTGADPAVVSRPSPCRCFGRSSADSCRWWEGTDPAPRGVRAPADRAAGRTGGQR